MPGERAQSGRAETHGYRRPGYPVGGLPATMGYGATYAAAR